MTEEQQGDRPPSDIINATFWEAWYFDEPPSLSLKAMGGRPTQNLSSEGARRNNAPTILEFKKSEDVLSVIFLQ
ncbi:hypothetical protein COCNU_scaffold002204G000010 [Cocos nucifera]|nr:hypothetical protein [Cocos nucifera]